MHEGVNDVRKGHINAPTDVVLEPEFVLSGLRVLLAWFCPARVVQADGLRRLPWGMKDAHADSVPAQSVGNLRRARPLWTRA